MSDAASPSHPPSEPRPSKRGRADFGGGYDRPARLQMVVALGLGLVLVAIPLYLWRRPRVESPLLLGDAEAPLPLAAAGPPDASSSLSEGDAGSLSVGEAKVLECHDPGPGHTGSEQCDRLEDFEKLFAKAIQESASCAPPASGGGLIPYLADVSFGRKRAPVHVMVAKDGRTLKNAKVVAACTAAVKKSLSLVSLDGMKHAHSRYKIAVTVSYPGKL